MATTETPRNKQGFKSPSTPKKGSNPTITANDSSGRGFTIAIIALVIIGMAGVAYLASNRDTTLTDAPQVSDVEVDGSPIPEYPSDANVSLTNAAVDGAVGNPAPILRGTNFEDEEIVIEGDGRMKAVYFLAHYCQFCQREVPVVQGIIDAGLQPENMDIYTVSTGVTPDGGANNYPPESWLLRENWTSPVMRDSASNTAFNAYGGNSFPYVVYLDGDNTVVARGAGEKSEAQTLDIWTQFAAGNLTAAQASEGDNSTSIDDAPAADDGVSEEAPAAEDESTGEQPPADEVDPVEE